MLSRLRAAGADHQCGHAMTTLPKYLTQDELQRYFKVITSPRDRALFALIYHYGLRVDEAAALTVEDIDLKNHRIRIRRLKNGIGGEKPLWRHTAKLLRAYLRVRRNVTPYLFIGRQGPMKKRMIQHLFAHYATAAGISTRNIHTLRSVWTPTSRVMMPARCTAFRHAPWTLLRRMGEVAVAMCV